MSINKFETLLSSMPRIAESVNSFKSDVVQQAAFSALLSALANAESVVRSEGKDETALAGAKILSKGNEASSSGRSPKRPVPSRGQWAFDRSLDLRPVGKISFVDFIETKKPRSNEERYVTTVYYLCEILEYATVSLHHIGSVFRLTPAWREPKALDAGLRMASLRKGTLETSDLTDIKLTPHGRNLVEHDLPAA